MAQYQIITYENTGFNSVNIPDSPDLLDQCKHTEWKVDDDSLVSMVQNRNLTSIRLPGSFTTFQNVDYVKVGNWFYSVPAGGINKVANNVVEIQLLSDPITSAGGFKREGTDVSAKFKILDGVTERCTTSSDAWGAYDMDDPLMAPQRPLKIKTEWLEPEGHKISYSAPSGQSDKYPNANESLTLDGDPVFLETTVNLESQAAQKEGVSYEDPQTGGNVICPKVFPNSTSKNVWGFKGTTDFGMPEGSNKANNGTRVYVRNDNTKYNSSSDSTCSDVINDAIESIRSLGVEQGSLINQWTVPENYVGSIELTHTTDTENLTGQYIFNVKGRKGSIKSTITPDYYKAKNKRLLYGDYNKYGLITTAGNSCEFNPEEITDDNTAPGITFESDVRPKGKPYFRFTTINGSSEFWRNALAGSEWANVPLVYQGSSGSALTRLNFQNQKVKESMQFEQFRERNQFSQNTNAINSVAGVATALLGGNFAGAAQSAYNGVVNKMQLDMTMNQQEALYKNQRDNELSQLYQSTTVFTPSVNFPYNADILRDIKGNAVLLYKYEYTDSDAERIDKLLTMYGYKTTQHLTIGHFYRRKHFDFVKCPNVSVGGLARWWNDQIGMMLRNGVRVWHELPNVDAYNDNPIL